MKDLRNSITWTQIFSGWPVLVTIVLVILSFATLITRITVVENKLDNATALLNKYIEKQEGIIQRVVVIETEHSMNRR